MSQKVKKWGTSLIATGISMSSFAVTTSAIINKTVTQNTSCGTMTCTLVGCRAGETAITSVANPANTIIAGVVGDDPVAFPNRITINYNSISASVTTGFMEQRSDPVSFWRRHEVRDGVQGYSVYTSVTNCTCP